MESSDSQQSRVHESLLNPLPAGFPTVLGAVVTDYLSDQYIAADVDQRWGREPKLERQPLLIEMTHADGSALASFQLHLPADATPGRVRELVASKKDLHKQDLHTSQIRVLKQNERLPAGQPCIRLEVTGNHFKSEMEGAPAQPLRAFNYYS